MSGSAAPSVANTDEYLLIHAAPCAVAFHATQVFRVGSVEEFPEVSLTELTVALGMSSSSDSAQATPERFRRVVVIGVGKDRLGLLITGRVSLIAAARVGRLSVPPLLRVHRSVAGVLEEAGVPIAILVDARRLLAQQGPGSQQGFFASEPRIELQARDSVLPRSFPSPAEDTRKGSA
jgi:hypothetical protein